MNYAIKSFLLSLIVLLTLGGSKKIKPSLEHRIELRRQDSIKCNLESKAALKGIYTLTTRVKEYVNSLPVAVVNSHSIYIKESAPLGSLSSRADLIEEAEKHLGTQYVYGGKGPETFDCSGFTSYVYKQFGIVISGGSEQQAVAGKSIPLSASKAGDLMFFQGTNTTRPLGRVSHVALIHTSNDSTLSIIHANGYPRGIEITYILKKGKYTIDWTNFWKKKYLYTKKILK